jgi:hypothetical protein
MYNKSYPKALPVFYVISRPSFRRRWGELLYAVLFIILGTTSQTNAQQLKLGINPTRINKAAVLELESGNQGLLLTRVDTLAVNHLIEDLSVSQQDSTNGMIVFQVSDSSLYLRKGGLWKKLVLADETGIVSLNDDSSKVQSLKLVNGTSHYPVPTLIDSVAGGHYLFLPYASKGTIGLVDNDYQQWYGTKVIRDALGLSYLSAGSVPFIGNDADHTLSQDATQLFWDQNNHRLGIGTNSPANNVEIDSKNSGQSGLRLTQLTASSTPDQSAGTIGVNASGDVVRVPGIIKTTGSVIGSFAGGVLNLSIIEQQATISVTSAEMGATVILSPTSAPPNAIWISNARVVTPGIITVDVFLAASLVDLGSLLNPKPYPYNIPVSIAIIQ